MSGPVACRDCRERRNGGRHRPRRRGDPCDRFCRESDADFAQIGSLLVFTIPGVLIGGQIGPRLLSGMPKRMLIPTLGWLFLVIAILTTFEAVAG